MIERLISDEEYLRVEQGLLEQKLIEVSTVEANHKDKLINLGQADDLTVVPVFTSENQLKT